MHNAQTEQLASVQAGQARADAENARLDAELELAAKKAAVAAMRKQAGEPAPAEGMENALASMPATVTYEKDGKTVTLVNPSPAQMEAVTQAMQPPPVEGWMLVTMTGMTFLTGVLITALYLWHRRKSRGVAGPAMSEAAEARMARMENAIESIAIEMERVSEGQRFATRLLTEGAAQHVAVSAMDAVPASPIGGAR
jgi:hypothetical protein